MILEGTPIHPLWSLDRGDWVPRNGLRQGERLAATAGTAIVKMATAISRTSAVYNLEVHGEHVYQVTELGILVHNPGGCSANLGNLDDGARLRSQLALEERLANGGRFVGPGGDALQLCQSRVAVFDSVTGRIFFDVSNAGSHLGVLQRHGLPGVTGRFVGGFLEATNDGRLVFRPESATFRLDDFGLPGNILDLIRGTGVSIPGGL